MNNPRVKLAALQGIIALERQVAERELAMLLARRREYQAEIENFRNAQPQVNADADLATLAQTATWRQCRYATLKREIDALEQPIRDAEAKVRVKTGRDLAVGKLHAKGRASPAKNCT